MRQEYTYVAEKVDGEIEVRLDLYGHGDIYGKILLLPVRKPMRSQER